MKPEKQKSFLIHFAYVAVILLLIALSAKILFVWLFPFAAGLAVAVLLRPAIRKLSKVSLLPRKYAAVIVTTLLYLAVLSGLWFLAVRVTELTAGILRSVAAALPDFLENQLAPFLARMQNRTSKTLSSLSGSFSGLGGTLSDSILEQLGNLSSSAVAWAGRLVKDIPSMLFTLTLSVLSSFLIAMDYPHVTAFVLAQIPARALPAVFECRKFICGQLWKIVKGYGIIMVLTFFELAAGLWMLRVPNFLAVSGLIALLDILPLIGTGGILIPWAAICLIQGERFLAVGIAVLYGIIWVVRTLCEPKIIGDQTGLPPLVTLTAMYVGWKLAGFAGIIGAPLAVMLLCWMNRTGTVKLWKAAEDGPQDQDQRT